MGRDAGEMWFVGFEMVILMWEWKWGREETHISSLILRGRRGNEWKFRVAMVMNCWSLRGANGRIEDVRR
jgi:hypothetical protein